MPKPKTKLTPRLGALFLLGVVSIFAACAGSNSPQTQTPPSNDPPPPVYTLRVGQSATLAVIGDFGVCGQSDAPNPNPYCPHEQQVSTLVHSWFPNAIMTVGDNAYDFGLTSEVPGDLSPYMDFISAKRFFPAFGNHDIGNGSLQPLLSFLDLPSPYYSVVVPGVLSAFMITITSTKAQTSWLQDQLSSSTTPWNLTFNHHAPYSSCGELSSPDWRWVEGPKVDVSYSGHSHVYERLLEPNADQSATIPYVVNGASGAPLESDCGNVLPGQQKAVYGAHGAVKVVVTSTSLTSTFYDINGNALDTFTITK
jgi:tartrate-resistant acid phosphatase type 5